jgi:hypothetical protein
MSWQEIFKKHIPYGKYDYQVWINGNKYTIERYIPATEETPTEHENTVLSGALYRCETMKDKIAQILDDIRGLADEIEEEYENNDTERQSD